MGAWGVALFSDDTASDVRSSYRELLEDGLGSVAATDRLLADFAAQIKDIDDGPIFWLALAAVQTKLGLLEDRVRAKAVAVIDSGADLARWEQENPKLVPKRQAILDALRVELLGPQRPVKKIRPYRPATTPFERGDVFSYRLDDGRFFLCRVIGVQTERRGDRHLIVEILDWLRPDLPDAKRLSSLRRRKSKRPYEPVFKLLLLPRPLREQLSLVGHIERPDRDADGNWGSLGLLGLPRFALAAFD